MDSAKRSFLASLSLCQLLLGMFVSVYYVQVRSHESGIPVGMTNAPERGFGLQDRWDASYDNVAYENAIRKRGTSDFDWGENGSARLIIQAPAKNARMDQLRAFIIAAGGNIVNTISVKESTDALTVEVPSDRLLSLTDGLWTKRLAEYVGPDFRVNASFIPNDPLWPNQWAPKKIETDQAWSTTTGSSEVLVAVIDTGIDYTHSDLAANYVPLGYDWVNNDANPMDDNGHGTHVAGIIAAQLNNSVGIAGIAQVRIMTEKVLDSSGSGYYSWVVEGIYHAVDSGAKIISMSLGGDADSPMVHDAVLYAYDHGVLLVAAAGNSGDDKPSYPAYYDEVIAVAATDSNDNRASFSTYGDWIDLAAPGVNILSTYPDNSYNYLSGTSMACPQVTGVAALTWSVFTSYTTGQIRTVLQRTADDLGDIGFDRYYGNGRVNARRAVQGLPEHDIAITGWQHPSRLDPGQEGTFNVTIANLGKNNETGINVRFLVNGTIVDSATINSLEIEASTHLNFSWSTTENGRYNITVYALPVEGENPTENNIVSSIMAVRLPATLRIPSEFSTIKVALEYAGDGDTILVSSGHYTEGEIDVFKDNISLVAEGRVVLDGYNARNVLRVEANGAVIEGFEVINCSSYDYAISIKGRDNVLRGNVVNRNREAVLLSNSYDSVVTLNNLTGNGGDGIVLQYSSNVTVAENICVGSSYFGGINVWRSSNNTISSNTITGGMRRAALDLWYSQNNLVTSNNLTGNVYGLVLEASPYNVFRDNIMINNTRNLCVWKSDVLAYSWQVVNDVDASNKVDGKPVYYWVSASDRVVPSDAGVVVLVYSQNIRIENLDLRNNLDGILLIDSHGTQIIGNNITANTGYPWETGAGISGYFDSSNTTITSNMIAYNENGISLWGGSNNTITMNDVTNSKMWALVIQSTRSTVGSNNVTTNDSGVSIMGSENTVSSNNIMSNRGYGIVLEGTNHTITANEIIAAGTFQWYGYPAIWMKASDSVISSNNIVATAGYIAITYAAMNNSIFHNNFINNTELFQNGDGASTNIWDDGYPSGGNYWSGYNGTDLKHGPYQNLTGSDGIGDTSYVLDSLNVDRYPLTNIFAQNPLPQTYALSLTAWVGNTQSSDPSHDTTNPLPKTWLYMPNMKVTVEALAHPYYSYFDHWELDGVNVGSEDRCTVLMNRNHELKAIFAPILPLVVSIAPAIAEVKVGEPITFSSLAKGGKFAYSYQWYLNGTSVWDGISPRWTFTPDTPGNYIVGLNVTSIPTTVKSNDVVVVVRPRPPVYVLPTSSFIYTGQSLQLSSTVTGMNPPYSYQWYMNGTAVPEATSPTWTFTADTPGYYTINSNVKDNLGSSATSDEASVTVVSPPIASISPSFSYTYFAQPVQFTSTVSNGYPPYSYQWVLNESTLVYKTTSFNFTRYARGNYTIYLNVTDIFGRTVKSNDASLIVKPELKVIISPATVSIIHGESANFTSTPSEGSSPIGYQWYINNSEVTGATSPTLTFNPAKAGRYIVYVNMTDELGITVKSDTAQVTVYVEGDANRDGVVDMRDIGILANNFMRTSNDPEWNPNYDTNGDDVINMRDIGIACVNFMKRL